MKSQALSGTKFTVLLVIIFSLIATSFMASAHITDNKYANPFSPISDFHGMKLEGLRTINHTTSNISAVYYLTEAEDTALCEGCLGTKFVFPKASGTEENMSHGNASQCLAVQPEAVSPTITKVSGSEYRVQSLEMTIFSCPPSYPHMCHGLCYADDPECPGCYLCCPESGGPSYLCGSALCCNHYTGGCTGDQAYCKLRLFDVWVNPATVHAGEYAEIWYEMCNYESTTQYYDVSWVVENPGGVTYLNVGAQDVSIAPKNCHQVVLKITDIYSDICSGNYDVDVNVEHGGGSLGKSTSFNLIGGSSGSSVSIYSMDDSPGSFDAGGSTNISFLLVNRGCSGDYGFDLTFRNPSYVKIGTLGRSGLQLDSLHGASWLVTFGTRESFCDGIYMADLSTTSDERSDSDSTTFTVKGPASSCVEVWGIDMPKDSYESGEKLEFNVTVINFGCFGEYDIDIEIYDSSHSLVVHGRATDIELASFYGHIWMFIWDIPANLRSGTYTIEAMATSFCGSYEDSDTFYLDADCDGTIVARVEDNYDNPIEGAKVYLDGAWVGATDGSGRRTMYTSDGSCGNSYKVETKCSDGRHCDTKYTTIDYDGDRDTLWFTCQQCLDLPDLRISVDAVSSYCKTDEITLDITVRDEYNNLIDGASIVVYDPLKKEYGYLGYETLTTSNGKASYTTTASRTGFFTFDLSASKHGYEAVTTSADLEIRNCYKITTAVKDKSHTPISGARVLLDGSEAGITDHSGRFGVETSKGWHTADVYCPNDRYCGGKQLWVNGMEHVYFSCECDPTGDLQVNVKNPNGYPVANVQIYLDSELKGATNPFGFLYMEDVPYGRHTLGIELNVTNPDYAGIYYETKEIIVDESLEKVEVEKDVTKLMLDFTIVPPGTSSNILTDHENDSQDFIFLQDMEDVSPQVAFIPAAMAVIDVASVGWSTEEWCRCAFEGTGFGVQQCMSAVKECSGDIRKCLDEIARNAGPTASKCAFEEAMLAGDVVSPLIPVGIAGHVIAKVVGKSRALRFIDDVGEISGKLWVRIEETGVVKYLKEGWEWFAKWMGTAFKKGLRLAPWFDDLTETSLKGWESIAKVDMRFAKELAGKLGKEGSERLGKEAAEELSEEALERLVKSKLGREALEAGWKASELKGLARLLKNSYETAAGRLKYFYGEEVFRITSKGIGSDVIDLRRVDADKLAKYVQHWRGDPLDDSAQMHKLIRMYKSKGVRTAVGDTSQWVDDVAVLKKGQHIGPNSGFGWEHIIGENHHVHIRDAFELSDSNDAVKKFIQEGLERGVKQSDGITIIYDKPGYLKKLKIVLSTDSPGSITTAMPWGG